MLNVICIICTLIFSEKYNYSGLKTDPLHRNQKNINPNELKKKSSDYFSKSSGFNIFYILRLNTLRQG